MDKKLLQSLLKPEAFDEPTVSVRLVQTHVSFLFLTDNYVYKIKKEVDLGFLNFSTLDRRRFYCDEEVRLNRRLCPEIYLGVMEVRLGPEGLNLRGEGSIADYAVKMKRLPAERMLDRLLDEDAVSDDDVRRIARTIAAFHLAADRGVEIDCYGSLEVIRQNWEENFNQLQDFVGFTIDRRDLGIVRGWVDRFMAANEQLFSARVRDGFVRDCDGDIHAENICLGDTICIFDCIEFNSRFRYSDTAADIAFLLMDFDFHGKRRLAEVFIAEYRVQTGDDGVVSLVNFYKVYRAVVRSKVESFRLRDPHLSEEERSVAGKRAGRYFRLARGYCLRGNLSPTLLIMCGLMGSGKSTLADELSFELGMDIFRSDVVRKELTSVGATCHQYEAYGEGIYSREITESTYRALLSLAAQRLQAGYSVVIDASFRHRGDRLDFCELAKKHSANFVIVFSSCGDELTRQRLAERMDRSDEVSDGRWELFERQLRDFDSVTDDEGRCIFVDTSISFNDSIDRILQGIGLL
ncbi:MAG TPA: AAA family ATPase [Geobacteraceae bacterium]